MAHALGEPDYYNPAYTSMGTGDWDIMAGGSWFGNPPGSNPTGFNPASKVFQGWITPKVIEESATDVTLAPRELQPTADYDVTQVDPTSCSCRRRRSPSARPTSKSTYGPRTTSTASPRPATAT